MKKSYIFITILNIVLLLLIVVSCTDNLPNEETIHTSDTFVEWNTVFDASRAVMDADGNGTFEEGDVIVVYSTDMNSGNVGQYILHLEKGKWLPEVAWKDVGDDVTFTAWYLSSGDFHEKINHISQDYVHHISQNQKDGGYENSDLLLAKVRVSVGEKVNLLFKHALSRLNVVWKSDEASYSHEQLNNADVRIYTPCCIKFNLSDGLLLEYSDYKWVTPLQNNNSFTAIICPRDIEAQGSEELLRINIDGNETVVKSPETLGEKPFRGFESGKQINYRLSLKDGNHADSFAGTTKWVYGVNESSPGQWNQDYTQLTWTENCGWFDCNKINPSGTSPSDDGLMCWAASASNLIHWWLAQNADTDAVKAYSGPNAIPVDMLHSDIFQLYKDNFPNKGEYPIKAINWFFNGVFQRKIYEMDPVDSKAGFFRTQLGINSLGKEYSGTDLICESFNSIIKQALTSRQGILFVINLGRSWSTHAVTLWGVKFDDEGLIDTLYMVDNNDGRYDKLGTVRAMKVQYLPYPSSGNTLYPYVPNSLGDFTIRIESLCTLSLGEEWIR